jgi:hypothetical protein
MPRHIYILTHPPTALCYGSVQKYKKMSASIDHIRQDGSYHLKRFLGSFHIPVHIVDQKAYDNIHNYSAHGNEMHGVHIVISNQHNNTDTLLIALYISRET